ncbi:MAG: DUF924 family protein [Elainellaceae cyanobacterium]
MINAAIATDVLTFWFGSADGTAMDYRSCRKRWFRKSASFDQTVRQRFEDIYRQVYAEAMSNQSFAALAQANPAQSLAITLLLDQFPRNMFRGAPMAFASDPQANAVAKAAIACGFDQQVPPVRRMFFYLPLEHSEFRHDQQQSVRLFEALAAQSPELQDTYDYALRHQQVIERFGRFPHRNPILGRRSTAAEVVVLKQPGSSF